MFTMPEQNEVRLFPVSEDSRWGYVDMQGRFVIAPRFERALGFSEGLARVRVNGCWGYIDAAGNMLIPPRFDDARAFFGGVAPVLLEGRWCCIDPQGKVVRSHRIDRSGQGRPGPHMRSRA